MGTKRSLVLSLLLCLGVISLTGFYQAGFACEPPPEPPKKQKQK
jgi:hypothetical protein